MANKVIFHKRTVKGYDSIKEWYYDSFIYSSYRYITKTFPERLFRALKFFKLGWYNYDFDNHYLNELVLFKLKRFEHCFIHYGHHSEECPNYKPKMKSLRLAIKLMERVCKAEYTRFYDKHIEKWGSRTISWEPYGEHFKMNTHLEKANTPELKDQERGEFLEAVKADDRLQARDIRIAYAIISKYQHYWWD